MRKRIAPVLLGLALVMTVTPACIGPFNASRRLHTWNREIENRWLGELVYLPFRLVIAVAAVGDLLIFNSLEFWGADNWIDPPSKERLAALREKDAARERAARGEEEADESSDEPDSEDG